MAKVYDRISIYLPKGERDDWQQLIEVLAHSGVDVHDEKRGGLSYAKMLRYLVQEERQRRRLITGSNH